MLRKIGLVRIAASVRLNAAIMSMNLSFASSEALRVEYDVKSATRADLKQGEHNSCRLTFVIKNVRNFT